MDGMAYKDYFLQPLDVWHRRYEVLRAVFVDEHRMKEVAQRFGVSYGTVRNWAGEFRSQRGSDQRPPFLPRRCVAVRLARRMVPNHRSPSPTSERCRWSRVGG